MLHLTMTDGFKHCELAQEWGYQQTLAAREAREEAIAELAAPHVQRMCQTPDIADINDALDEITDSDQARIAQGWRSENAAFGELMRNILLSCFERVTEAAAEARLDRIEQIMKQEGEAPACDTGVDALTFLEQRAAAMD